MLGRLGSLVQLRKPSYLAKIPNSSALCGTERYPTVVPFPSIPFPFKAVQLEIKCLSVSEGTHKHTQAGQAGPIALLIVLQLNLEG